MLPGTVGARLRVTSCGKDLGFLSLPVGKVAKVDVNGTVEGTPVVMPLTLELVSLLERDDSVLTYGQELHELATAKERPEAAWSLTGIIMALAANAAGGKEIAVMEKLTQMSYLFARIDNYMAEIMEAFKELQGRRP